MHNNGIYRAFLLTVLAATLWYTGKGLYKYYEYSVLKEQVKPIAVNWSVAEISSDEFIQEAAFTFEFHGKNYEGRSSWPNEFYRNRWAAEQDHSYFAKQYPFVWFDPSDPNHSSLQKKFPFKECISAILLWGLSLYFFWLGYYIAKFKH